MITFQKTVSKYKPACFQSEIRLLTSYEIQCGHVKLKLFIALSARWNLFCSLFSISLSGMKIPLRLCVPTSDRCHLWHETSHLFSKHPLLQLLSHTSRTITKLPRNLKQPIDTNSSVFVFRESSCNTFAVASLIPLRANT